MAGYQIAILAIIATVLALFLLWLYLIAPRARQNAVKPFCRPLAHRGIWNEDVPENSLAAFERAAAAGFGIELDVQLSSDGEVMVFHDDTLSRMCGKEGRLGDYAAAELGEMHLLNSDQAIPTLREVLAVVAGRVPLLIEMKGESRSTALVPPLLAVMREYSGEWCVESFNPLLVRAVWKSDPTVLRGLLVTDMVKEKKGGPLVRNLGLSAMLLNFLCRPAFVAWNCKFPKSITRAVAFRCFGAASFTYTVKDEAAYQAFLESGTTPIFDSFIPQ